MIKQTVSAYDVIEQAKAMNKIDNFGHDGWRALFQCLEGLSDETGDDIELDIVAWCCDFTRFESVEDYNSQYNTEYVYADDVHEIACMIDDGPAFICYAH